MLECSLDTFNRFQSQCTEYSKNVYIYDDWDAATKKYANVAAQYIIETRDVQPVYVTARRVEDTGNVFVIETPRYRFDVRVNYEG